jgi:hypothetical protein
MKISIQTMSNKADNTDVFTTTSGLSVLCSRCGTSIAVSAPYCSVCGESVNRTTNRPPVPIAQLGPPPLPRNTGTRGDTSNRVVIAFTIIIGLLIPIELFLYWSWEPQVPLTAEDRAGVPVVFKCPARDCEVATSIVAMTILVLHRTDTPGDNGIFDSATRTKGYLDAIRDGSIITIRNGTHGVIRYRTDPATVTPTRYSVVKVLDGPYAGHPVLTTDACLWTDNQTHR